MKLQDAIDNSIIQVASRYDENGALWVHSQQEPDVVYIAVLEDLWMPCELWAEQGRFAVTTNCRPRHHSPPFSATFVISVY